MAGFSGAVLAVAGANAEAILDGLHSAARACAGISLLIGVLLLIVALVAALRGILLPQPSSPISLEEVANYATERFIHEPDLWRVQVRTIRGLLVSIESATGQGDQAARAVGTAARFFLTGLFAAGNALGILILVMTF